VVATRDDVTSQPRQPAPDGISRDGLNGLDEDPDRGTMPCDLAAKFDALPPSVREMFRPTPKLTAPDQVELCTIALRHNGWTPDEATKLAGYFPDGFGHLKTQTAAAIAETWRERDGASLKEAQADAVARLQIAEYFSVTDEPIDASAIPQRAWIAGPYVMRRQITLPHGPGGSGKSQLIIAWAIALALGRPFGRLRPKHRFRVLLTNFEDDRDEQNRRIIAALEYFGATMADLKGWLFRVTISATADATMFELDEFGAVKATECFATLQLLCQRIKPDVVALDPLVAINSVPEGNNTLMRRVMTMLRADIAIRFDIALILVHHDNKGGDGSEDNDAASVRGASDIVNAVRFELAVRHMTTAQAEGWDIEPERRANYFRLGSLASKRNYVAAEESEWFEHLATVVNGEAVVRCIPWQPPSGKLSEDQMKQLIGAIEKATPSGPYSPKLGEYERSLSPVFEAIGVTATAAQRRALNDLLRAGQVEKAKFRRPGHGDETRTGLRTAARLPYNYEWCDLAEAEPC